MPEIHLWRIDTSAYRWGASELGTLSRSERRHADRLAERRMQENYLGAHAALRRILADWTGIAASELRFDSRCRHCGDDAHGRPVLDNETASPAPSFSLSRRDRYAIVAVSQVGIIGADLERRRANREWEAMRERVFTPAEAAELAGLGEAAAACAATVWWTRKEAVSKALGLGLALAFEALGTGGWQADGWLPAGEQTGQRGLVAAPDRLLVCDAPAFDDHAAALGFIGPDGAPSLVLHDLP